MKIKEFELFSYQLPLKRPFRVKNRHLTEREGLVVRMKNDEGHTIYTDIAPLPFFNRESLAETLEELRKLKPLFLDSYWSHTLLGSAQNLLSLHSSSKKFPSLHFGLEMGLFYLLTPKIPLHVDPLFTCFLLAGDKESILHKAKTLKNPGTVKLKLHSFSIPEAIALTCEIRKIMPEAELRLDFNRSLSLEQAKAFCAPFSPLDFQYLEEPLRNPHDLLSFSHDTHFPLAFDESIFDLPLPMLLQIPTKKAFVLKPTLLGSLKTLLNFHKIALKFDLKVVLSSALESGLGHLMLLHLAHWMGENTSIGIDTYDFLEEDILKKRLSFSKGLIHLGEYPLSQIHLQNLTAL